MSSSKTKFTGEEEQEIRTTSDAESSVSTEGEPGAADGGEAEPRAEDLAAKVTALEESLLRAKADFQNLQRRAAAERAESIRFANADIMRSLLGVLDDFERALQASDEAKKDDPVIEGVRLVYDNLTKALSEAGLTAIEAQGQLFDPTVHEALLQQPTGDAPPGTVVEQVAKGYMLRDRVLRPARVIVAKAPENSDGTA